MRGELTTTEMSILRGYNRIEVRSFNFGDFYWPEQIRFEGKLYRFQRQIPLSSSRSIIFSSSAIYELVLDNEL